MVDFTEVALAVVAIVVVICSPVVLMRAFDWFVGRSSAPSAAQPSRKPTLVAADLRRLRGDLSDESITVGDRRRAVAEYDRVLAEACRLVDQPHALGRKGQSHLDRELERFRVEATLQAAGWTLIEPRRRGQDA